MEKVSYRYHHLQRMRAIPQISQHPSPYSFQEAELTTSDRNPKSETKPLAISKHDSSKSSVSYTISYA